MNTPEFIEKWLVGYESLEQKAEFEIEMKADLASLNRQGCRWTDDLVVDLLLGLVATRNNAKNIIYEFKNDNRYSKFFDESIEPCATSSEKEFKEECERLAGLVKFWQEKYYELNPPHKNPKIDNL